MRTKFQSAQLVLPYHILTDAWLLCEDGDIVSYGQGTAPEGPFDAVYDLGGAYLCPGFVDLHVHGGAGADFRDGEEDAFLRAMRAHLAGGTTAMLATLSSAALPDILQSLRVYGSLLGKADTLHGIPHLYGVHLEGPYFSQNQRGAQDPALIRLPDPAEYRQILEAAPFLRRWSIACELPGALDLAGVLRRRGVTVSIGHSDATTAQAFTAFAHGFTSVTHLYSSCSTLHRNGPFREGGVVEAAYLIDEMDVEVIADGVHLPPDFLRLVHKIKGPDHIALVTDCIRAGAVDWPAGVQVYDDKERRHPLLLESGVAILPDRTSFAGSIATTSQLVRTMAGKVGVPLPEAVRMAALTPARMLGLDTRIGSIACGKQADLVALDKALEVQAVWLAGKEAFKRTENRKERDTQ